MLNHLFPPVATVYHPRPESHAIRRNHSIWKTYESEQMMQFVRPSSLRSSEICRWQSCSSTSSLQHRCLYVTREPCVFSIKVTRHLQSLFWKRNFFPHFLRRAQSRSRTCMFSSLHTSITNFFCKALVIDGGSLLETRPQSRNCTVNQYAIQLLEAKILRLFDVYSRVDIVFDSTSSKEGKQFIERHTNDGKHSDYDLKEDDILDASFHKFVNSNRVELATLYGNADRNKAIDCLMAKYWQSLVRINRQKNRTWTRFSRRLHPRM